VAINESEWQKKISANSPETVLTLDQITLSTGDYLEVYVANHDTTADILVHDVNFLVIKT
jgi:hypothetical protein